MSDLANRFRFSWDPRRISWTNRKGNQEEFVYEVKSWESFRAALPDSNSKKLTENLLGTMLHSLVCMDVLNISVFT